MPKRIVSFLLALCYLSVSLIVFSSHAHDHGDRVTHSCPACVWHSDNILDEPVGAVSIAAPLILVVPAPASELQIKSSVLSILSDRGPPSLS